MFKLTSLLNTVYLVCDVLFEDVLELLLSCGLLFTILFNDFYEFHSFVIDTACPSIYIWYDGNFLHLAVRTFLIIFAKFLSGLFCLNALH